MTPSGDRRRPLSCAPKAEEFCACSPSGTGDRIGGRHNPELRRNLDRPLCGHRGSRPASRPRLHPRAHPSPRGTEDELVHHRPARSIPCGHHLGLRLELVDNDLGTSREHTPIWPTDRLRSCMSSSTLRRRFQWSIDLGRRQAARNRPRHLDNNTIRPPPTSSSSSADPPDLVRAPPTAPYTPASRTVCGTPPASLLLSLPRVCSSSWRSPHLFEPPMRRECGLGANGLLAALTGSLGPPWRCPTCVGTRPAPRLPVSPSRFGSSFALQAGARALPPLLVWISS